MKYYKAGNENSRPSFFTFCLYVYTSFNRFFYPTKFSIYLIVSGTFAMIKGIWPSILNLFNSWFSAISRPTVVIYFFISFCCWNIVFWLKSIFLFKLLNWVSIISMFLSKPGLNRQIFTDQIWEFAKWIWRCLKVLRFWITWIFSSCSILLPFYRCSRKEDFSTWPDLFSEAIKWKCARHKNKNLFWSI